MVESGQPEQVVFKINYAPADANEEAVATLKTIGFSFGQFLLVDGGTSRDLAFDTWNRHSSRRNRESHLLGYSIVWTANDVCLENRQRLLAGDENISVDRYL